MRIAIGDVHGCYDELIELLHSKYKITKSDEIYFVGDLISKGPNSLKVLEHLIGLVEDGYKIESVLGNHEFRLIDSFHNDFDLFESYLEEYNCKDILSGEIDVLIKFLESFPFYVLLDNWVIAHSEIGSEENYSQSDARFILGERHFRSLYFNNELNDRHQVFGHVVRALDDILMDCVLTSTKINIDGGCVYPEYGYLCGLDLDTFNLTYVNKK